MARIKHDPKVYPRVKLHYTGATGNHCMNFHLPAGALRADAEAMVANMAQNFKALIGSAYQFTTAEFAKAGTGVYNPITFTPVNGTNTNGAVVSQKAGFMSFTGKTEAGTRIMIGIFTDQGWNEVNYRVVTPLPSAVLTALNWLNNPLAYLVAIDGLVPTFHSYANYDSHGHFVNRLRR